MAFWIGLGIVLLALLIFVLAAAYHCFNKILVRKHTSAQKENTAVIEQENEESPENQNPLFDQTWFWDSVQEVSRQSEDAVRLHGYFVSNPRGAHRFAILCHGYCGNGLDLLEQARQFYTLGFHILLPDARAHGKSEGKIRGMGWLERKDLAGWCRGIAEGDPDAEIILYGVSMGGSAVMMAAGEPLPKQVKLAIEDCGYSSVWEEFSCQIKKMFHLPVFPFLHLTSIFLRLKGGYSLEEADAVQQMRTCFIPLLFIHGEEDSFVPFWMLQKVYDAKDGKKELLSIPGAGHAQSSLVAPERYWKTIQCFLNRHLESECLPVSK